MFAEAAVYLNKAFVSIYKVLGFIILTIIVAGMFFYLASSGFYLLSTSWIVPSILTPDNDKVIQARFQYLEYTHQFEKLAAEQLEVERQSVQLAFAYDLQRQFQLQLTKALLTEKKRAGKDLQNFSYLLANFKKNRAQNETRPLSYSKELQDKLKKQLDQGLIGREDFLRNQHLISQWVSGQISQQEKLNELEKKVESLERNSHSLPDLKGDSPEELETSLLNFLTEEGSDLELLLKEQPLITSALSTSEIAAKQEVLKKRAEYLKQIIAEYKETLVKLDSNPYVRASRSQVNMAFVPYSNLSSLDKDTKIIGCYLEFIICTRVGNVTKVLDGEVTVRHPLNGRELRGQMVEISVKDNSWTKSRTLLTGHAPFLL